MLKKYLIIDSQVRLETPEIKKQLKLLSKDHEPLFFAHTSLLEIKKQIRAKYESRTAGKQPDFISLDDSRVALNEVYRNNKSAWRSKVISPADHLYDRPLGKTFDRVYAELQAFWQGWFLGGKNDFPKADIQDREYINQQWEMLYADILAECMQLLLMPSISVEQQTTRYEQVRLWLQQISDFFPQIENEIKKCLEEQANEPVIHYRNALNIMRNEANELYGEWNKKTQIFNLLSILLEKIQGEGEQAEEFTLQLNNFLKTNKKWHTNTPHYATQLQLVKLLTDISCSVPEDPEEFIKWLNILSQISKSAKQGETVEIEYWYPGLTNKEILQKTSVVAAAFDYFAQQCPQSFKFKYVLKRTTNNDQELTQMLHEEARNNKLNKVVEFETFGMKEARDYARHLKNSQLQELILCSNNLEVHDLILRFDDELPKLDPKIGARLLEKVKAIMRRDGIYATMPEEGKYHHLKRELAAYLPILQKAATKPSAPKSAATHRLVNNKSLQALEDEAKDPQLKRIIGGIKRLEQDLKKLRGISFWQSSSEADLAVLISDLNKIVEGQYTKQPRKSYRRAIHAIEAAFACEQAKFIRAAIRNKTDDDFIHALNANPDAYHYARLLALNLQLAPSYDDYTSDFNLEEKIQRVQIPHTKKSMSIYGGYARDKYQEEETRNKFDDLWNIIFPHSSELQVAEINLIDCYRLLEGIDFLYDPPIFKKLFPELKIFTDKTLEDFFDSLIKMLGKKDAWLQAAGILLDAKENTKQGKKIISQTQLQAIDKKLEQIFKGRLLPRLTEENLAWKMKIRQLKYLVERANTVYKIDLKRSTHIKDFKQLSLKLERISEDRSLSYEKRYIAMVGEISKALTQQRNHFFYGFLTSRFRSNKIGKTPAAFLAYLNGKKNAYHYPRLLAGILQEVVMTNANQQVESSFIAVHALSEKYVLKKVSKDLQARRRGNIEKSAPPAPFYEASWVTDIRVQHGLLKGKGAQTNNHINTSDTALQFLKNPSEFPRAEKDEESSEKKKRI